MSQDEENIIIFVGENSELLEETTSNFIRQKYFECTVMFHSRQFNSKKSKTNVKKNKNFDLVFGENWKNKHHLLVFDLRVSCTRWMTTFLECAQYIRNEYRNNRTPKIIIIIKSFKFSTIPLTTSKQADTIYLLEPTVKEINALESAWSINIPTCKSLTLTQCQKNPTLSFLNSEIQQSKSHSNSKNILLHDVLSICLLYHWNKSKLVTLSELQEFTDRCFDNIVKKFFHEDIIEYEKYRNITQGKFCFETNQFQHSLWKQTEDFETSTLIDELNAVKTVF